MVHTNFIGDLDLTFSRTFSTPNGADNPPINRRLRLLLGGFIRLFGIFISHQPTQELDPSDMQPSVPNGLH